MRDTSKRRVKLKREWRLSDWFRKNPAFYYFTKAQPIPSQLKAILKANPDYEVRYAIGPDGKEIKVSPKKQNIRELLRTSGMQVSLRGIGFTRPSKKRSKKNRKTAFQSRKRNRK